MSEVATQDIPATQQIGVGFIGAGIWATNSLLPNILQKPNARIEAVYSRSETSATKFAMNALIQDRKISIYCGEQLADLLKRDDIDVVIIALPIGGQSEIIIQALEHGKCVFSEKPIAATSQDAHKLMELYEQKYASQGLVWFIGENYHFEPAFLYAAEVIKSNRLGTILFGRYLFSKSMNPNVGYYHTKWRRNPQFPGGYFLDQGVHDAAGIRTIFNKKIESVYAQGRLVNADLEPLDTISAIFKFKDQTMLSYDFTFALSEKGIAEHQVFVVGSEGRMTLTRMLKSENSKKTLVWRVEELLQGENFTRDFKVDGVGLEIDQFFSEVLRYKNGSKEVNKQYIVDSFNDLMVVETALRSIQTQKQEIVETL